MSAIECPRCWRDRWRATGRFNVNRRDQRRAELRCEGCGYVFSSMRAVALAAGEAVVAAGDADPGPAPAPLPATVVPMPTLPFGERRHASAQPFVSTADLARRAMADYKRKASGDE